jgi:hypothetical protein
VRRQKVFGIDFPKFRCLNKGNWERATERIFFFSVEMDAKKVTFQQPFHNSLIVNKDLGVKTAAHSSHFATLSYPRKRPIFYNFKLVTNLIPFCEPFYLGRDFAFYAVMILGIKVTNVPMVLDNFFKCRLLADKIRLAEENPAATVVSLILVTLCLTD